MENITHILSEEKTMQASVSYATKIKKDGAEGNETDISIDFREGVTFAETELKNLAIEFWEYGMKRLMSVNEENKIPPRTFDLFQQFLSQRP